MARKDPQKGRPSTPSQPSASLSCPPYRPAAEAHMDDGSFSSYRLRSLPSVGFLPLPREKNLVPIPVALGCPLELREPGSVRKHLPRWLLLGLAHRTSGSLPPSGRDFSGRCRPGGCPQEVSPIPPHPAFLLFPPPQELIFKPLTSQPVWGSSLGLAQHHSHPCKEPFREGQVCERPPSGPRLTGTRLTQSCPLRRRRAGRPHLLRRGPDSQPPLLPRGT